MPYEPHARTYNPYDYPSPYQLGQTIPSYDEGKMMDINVLARYSSVLCNISPVGSCMRAQMQGSLHCRMHSCTAVLTDGSACPNSCPAGDQICLTGYHQENGRFPILLSPRSTTQSSFQTQHEEGFISSTSSYETVYSAMDHQITTPPSSQQDHSSARGYAQQAPDQGDGQYQYHYTYVSPTNMQQTRLEGQRGWGQQGFSEHEPGKKYDGYEETGTGSGWCTAPSTHRG